MIRRVFICPPKARGVDLSVMGRRDVSSSNFVLQEQAMEKSGESTAQQQQTHQQSDTKQRTSQENTPKSSSEVSSSISRRKGRSAILHTRAKDMDLFPFSGLGGIDEWFDQGLGRDPLLQDFNRWRRSLSRTLQKGLGLPGSSLLTSEWNPVADIQDTKDSYIITAEIPGVPKEDVKVEFDTEREILTIRGERREEIDEKDPDSKRIISRESSYGSFCRVFTLPEKVDPKHVKASYKDGVLKINIPKEATAERAVSINVE
jgi:HSP20 family protein